MSRDVFSNGGSVGADLARVDWAATPVGDPSGWSQSLVTMVRVLLGSRFSMWMAWGSQLTFFCNEAYRRDTLGEKYPWALGRSAREVWAEIWPEIGPRIETVMRTGEATWDESLLLFLERSGYREETYHTFSYSPLNDDDGTINGMLCVVSEDTDHVIGSRRMATLRDLGSDPTAVRTEAEVVTAACRHLARNRRSLPWVAFYRFDNEGAAHCVGASGISVGHPAAPVLIAAGEPAPAWPTAALRRGEAVGVDRLGERFGSLPMGAWDEPPLSAYVVPLPQAGHSAPYGFMVAAVNRYRSLDDGYRSFVRLIAGQVASGIATARAYEHERERAERLAELDRAKTAFFTNISHEFRTPLTLMLGPAEDALTEVVEPLGANQRNRIEIVLRNGQRLLRMVNTLLDFSRLEAGRAIAKYEPVDLARYTTELAGTFGSATERVGLRLTVDAAPLPQPVWVDREMWAKIVLNLLSNALKFTFEGSITVTVSHSDGAAVLAVSDTGTGIHPREQARLFERFHRVTGARSRTHEGSGIGLALVAELVSLHGGEVDVESVPGAGSTFRVRLPFGDAHLPADQVVEAAPDPHTADLRRQVEGFLAEALRWNDEVSGDILGPSRDDRPRILVADDNVDMREYLTRLLEGDYQVVAVHDGVEALEAALDDPPDLVLTDVMMPRMDGFQLLDALRNSAPTAELPVVVLSARAGEEATIEGLDAGADDYLVKPFSARELLARVRANLELDRGRRTRATLQRSQDLLDQAQRLARVGSWELDLTTGAITASDEFVRQIGMSRDALRETGFDKILSSLVHPEDVGRVRAALEAAADGAPLDYEIRLISPVTGEVRTFHTVGELERGEEGHPLRLRGSNQDITDQRRAERVLAAAAAEREAMAREHRIADELQASLLPAPTFLPEHLRVATYYRAGAQGAQVGGDWYDVIELGAGRTALVIGDVMGRGVRAAAVMGQLRSAVRAYARLDLPPAEILDYLDGVVRDLGEDHIVTCIIAVYDPGERRLSCANAGHLPPVLRLPGKAALAIEAPAGPPLGAGAGGFVSTDIALPPGAMLMFYTDGLVESRDRDIDHGVAMLEDEIERLDGVDDNAPTRIVDALLPVGSDDDIAILLVQVEAVARPHSVTIGVPAEARAVQSARADVAATLRSWKLSPSLVDDAVLLTSELVTNAILHGRAPINVRLRRTPRNLVLEVYDGATILPRRLRPTPDDEHGRGLLLVSLLSDRWGTRPTEHGKAVWCVLALGE